MNMKRILVLVMTFAMLMSTFAPTLGVFAEELNNDTNAGGVTGSVSSDKDDTLIYVSIGDSMTNGYGLPGYDGVSGIMNYGTNTYSNKFAAWLAGYEGEIVDNQFIFTGDNGTVEHRQLAMSGMDAETFLWMLELDHAGIVNDDKKAQDANGNWYSTMELYDIADNGWNGWISSGVIDGINRKGVVLNDDGTDALKIYNEDGTWYYSVYVPYFPDFSEQYTKEKGIINVHTNSNGDDISNKAGSHTDLAASMWFDELGFTSGHYFRAFEDIFSNPKYRMGDGVAKILYYYFDENGSPKGTFVSDYMNGVDMSAVINGVSDPEYPTSNEQVHADFGDDNWNWLRIAAEFYQDSIANADVISMAQGNTNFGTLMFNEIKNVIKGGDCNFHTRIGMSLTEDPDFSSLYARSGLSKDVIAEIKKLVKNQMDPIIDNLMSDMFGQLKGYQKAEIKLIIKYTVLSYLITYTKTVQHILTVNPDATLIQVALMNAYASTNEESEDSISMGSMIDLLYTPINAYIAAIPSLLGATNSDLVEDATFIYTDCGIVETLSEVFGNDYYETEDGESVAYPGLDLSDDLKANESSVIRNRFRYWIAGDINSGYSKNYYLASHGLSYGEVWKGLLKNFVDDDTTNGDFFGNYDLMYVTNEDLVTFTNMSYSDIESKLMGTDKAERDWVFSCYMYLAIEDAIIRSGKQSFDMNSLGKFRGINMESFAGALDSFYGSAGISGMKDSVSITSLADLISLMQKFSDAMVNDPTVGVIFCIANRMEIGTGIGGHTSEGGHDHMYEMLRYSYASNYTSEDELASITGNTGLDKVYFALLSKDYLTVAQTLEIVNGLAEHFEITDLENIEFTQDDIRYAVEYVYDYLTEKNTAADARIDIIKVVYASLNGDVLGEYSPALDTVGAIYSRLYESQLVSNEEAFNIVDFVYNRIIDFKVDDRDVYEIVTYIYKTLFGVKEEPKVVLFSNNLDLSDEVENFKAAIDVAEKVEIIEIIFDELKNSEYVEENPDLQPVVDLYYELKADENVEDEHIVAVFDIVFEKVSEKTLDDGEIDTNALASEIVNDVLTTDELDVTAKATIANKVVEVINNSTLPEGSGAITVPVIPELPDLTKIANILNVLKAEGYVTEAEINDVMGKAMALLMNGELDVESAVELVAYTYELVLADLSYEEQGEFVAVLYDAIKVEYDLTDEEVVKIAIEVTLEYYDEAYLYGYEYVDTNGYVDVAVEVLDKVIARLELVDLADNGPMTEEFKAEMHKEIDAMIETLKELREVLATDSAKDVEGFVKAVLALEDDLYTHLNNIYDILAQAGIDVNQLVIIPALKEALEIIETEVIPALEQLVEEFIDAVVAHVTEKAEALYSYALGLTKEAYEALVEAIVRIQLHVEEKVDEIIDTVLEQYFALLEKLEEIYGNVEDAVDSANKVLDSIVDKITEVADKYADVIAVAKDILVTVYNVLVESGLTVEDALHIAVEVYRAVAEFIAEHGEQIVDGVELAKVVFETVYNFLVEHGEEIKAAYEIAVKVVTEVVEFVVEHEEDIEKAIEIAVEVFEFVLEAAKTVYETAQEAYEAATKLYAALVEVIVRIHGAVEDAIDVYNYVYELMVDVFGSIEDAARVALKLTKLIVEFIKNNPELFENIHKLYTDIYDIIVDVYGETQDAEETAKSVYEYLVGVVVAVKEDVAEIIYDATNGDYTITEDSYYVAIGNADYAEKLAAMLYLGGKYGQFELNGDYNAALENADLVTIKLDNGESFKFAYNQVMGTLAEILRDHSNLQSIYDTGLGAVLENSLGFDPNATTVELDWSKYMDAEAEELLHSYLDSIKEDLIASGCPEALDIAPSINAVIINFASLAVVGEVNINVAELLVYALESALYAYAESMNRVVTTLVNVHELAPNATVVITGVTNPFVNYIPMLDAYEEYVGDLAQYLGYADYVADAMNAGLFAVALANENTIFVNSNEAEDIYEALHAHCAHAYDDCEDTVCNICGETRVAPGHVWGEWVTVLEPTTDAEGRKEHTCEVCGKVESESIDKLPEQGGNEGGNEGGDNTGDDNKGEDNTQTPVVDDEKGGLGTGAIIAIVVGCVAVACGAGALIYFYVIKKKRA